MFVYWAWHRQRLLSLQLHVNTKVVLQRRACFVSGGGCHVMLCSCCWLQEVVRDEGALSKSIAKMES